jgi:hypothetical protein
MTWVLLALICSPLIIAYPPDPSRWISLGGEVGMVALILVLLFFQMVTIGGFIKEDTI